MQLLQLDFFSKAASVYISETLLSMALKSAQNIRDVLQVSASVFTA